MKAEQLREITGRFLLNELGDPPPPPLFVIQIQMAHSRVQYIAKKS